MCVSNYLCFSCICDICSKPLKSIRMLAQHKSNFHGIDVPCTCRTPKCGLVFPSFKEESKHFRQVHQKFQTTCHICGKMLLGKGLLQKHIEQEHSEQVQKVNNVQYYFIHPTCHPTCYSTDCVPDMFQTVENCSKSEKSHDHS